MTQWTEQSLADHVRGFLDCTLSRDEWNPHQSHLATAVWHLRRFPPEVALGQMRAAIQRFNLSVGNPNGYHETVTQFFMRLLANVMVELDIGQPTAALANAVIAHLGTSRDDRLELFGEYYSDPEGTLGSRAARMGWTPPDRKRLDWPGR